MRAPRAGVLLAGLLVLPAPVWASENPLLPTVEVTAPRAPACVAGDATGKQVADFACLSQRMASDANKGAGPVPQLGSEVIAGRPPSALGLAHREATRQRMGNTFGRSTVPQRPPPPPPPPPFGQSR